MTLKHIPDNNEIYCAEVTSTILTGDKKGDTFTERIGPFVSMRGCKAGCTRHERELGWNNRFFDKNDRQWYAPAMDHERTYFITTLDWEKIDV